MGLILLPKSLLIADRWSLWLPWQEGVNRQLGDWSENVTGSGDVRWKTRHYVPLELTFEQKKERVFPGPFIPNETYCSYCPGASELQLNPATTGELFNMSSKVNGVKVHTKTCPRCKMCYRYQEITDGYHNFNNHSFFSLRLLENILVDFFRNVFRGEYHCCPRQYWS